MNKEQKMLRGLDLATAKGIEIGALDKPVVPPSSPGIFYVDYADTATLRHNYRNDPNVDVTRIVNVSGIWGDKTLAEITAPVAPVDFVVASHVIEHVPDLITWLQELASVLKPDGEVRLAVPDKRFSFDVLRGETQYADVLSAYLVRARVPQARAVIDHVINITTVDCARVWDGSLDIESLVPHNRPEHGEAIGRDVLENGTYHDVHCWVFTPWSFTRIMQGLAEAGHLRFKCTDFLDTERDTLEFFVTLRRCDDKPEIVESWTSLQIRLKTEQVSAFQARQKEATAREAALNHEIMRLRSDIERIAAECKARLREATAREDVLNNEIVHLRSDIERVAGERNRASAHAADLERAVAELEHSLLQITQSRSWKITAPLRTAMTLLRR